VIGAGASSEAGLPIGRGLADIVASRLDFRFKEKSWDTKFGDTDIIDLLQSITRTWEEIEPYLQAAKRIKEGVILSNSIDSFIDVHKDNEKIQLCGKLAIAKSILEAERESKLYLNKDNSDFADVVGLKQTWFFDFFRNLNDGVRKPEIERIFDKVSFVVFNYDRCIEHFLHQALQRHFGIEESDATAVMERLRIFHPYGTVADLPWQNNREGVPFGHIANRATMKLMASRIKTYTEQVEDDGVLKEIHDEFTSADTLVFLGFSFHPQNMKLLSPGKECATTQVFGTAFQISESNREVILDDIRNLVRKPLREDKFRGIAQVAWEPLYIHNLRCSELIQEFSRSLFVAGPSRH
jgi:hypothetical protein